LGSCVAATKRSTAAKPRPLQWTRTSTRSLSNSRHSSASALRSFHALRKVRQPSAIPARPVPAAGRGPAEDELHLRVRPLDGAVVAALRGPVHRAHQIEIRRCHLPRIAVSDRFRFSRIAEAGSGVPRAPEFRPTRSCARTASGARIDARAALSRILVLSHYSITAVRGRSGALAAEPLVLPARLIAVGKDAEFPQLPVRPPSHTELRHRERHAAAPAFDAQLNGRQCVVATSLERAKLKSGQVVPRLRGRADTGGNLLRAPEDASIRGLREVMEDDVRRREPLKSCFQPGGIPERIGLARQLEVCLDGFAHSGDSKANHGHSGRGRAFFSIEGARSGDRPSHSPSAALGRRRKSRRRCVRRLLRTNGKRLTEPIAECPLRVVAQAGPLSLLGDHRRSDWHDFAMTECKNKPKTTASERPIEHKGIVTEVVVPIVASGVGGAAAGAANAIVSDAIKKPTNDK
jgi:hypothetical protein